MVEQYDGRHDWDAIRVILYPNGMPDDVFRIQISIMDGLEKYYVLSSENVTRGLTLAEAREFDPDFNPGIEGKKCIDLLYQGDRLLVAYTNEPV